MKCIDACYHYLKYDRTEFEVRKHLERQGFPSDQIETAIQKAKEYDYINDYTYAYAYIRDHIYLNKWGPIKIKHALSEKGITESYVEEILDDFEDAIIENIKDILESKYGDVNLDEYSTKAKVFRYFYQKGYSSYQVESVLSYA